MLKRITQPPVNPAARDAERHEFWSGFIVAAIGLLLAVSGAWHVTGVETVDGGTAWETQLVKAFSSGGLQYPQQVGPTLPPRMDDPAAEAEALERWARQRASATSVSWKVRVDLNATTPCPT